MPRPAKEGGTILPLRANTLKLFRHQSQISQETTVDPPIPICVPPFSQLRFAEMVAILTRNRE